MHKFMRTVGFSMYQRKQDMDRILRRLAKEGAGTQCLDEKDGGQEGGVGPHPLRVVEMCE